MPRYRYSDVVDRLRPVIGAGGGSADSPRVMRLINAAMEELWYMELWPETVAVYEFGLADGQIALPSDLETILECTVQYDAKPILAGWAELVEHGPGLQDEYSRGGVDAVVDRGNFMLARDLPDGDWNIEVEGELDERVDGVRPIVTLEGWDANGLWVRTSGQDGETVEINGDTAPKKETSTSFFSGLKNVSKPVTKGYVTLWASNGSTRYFLAQMAPRDTAPQYRRYVIGSYRDSSSPIYAVARCRKRFLPVTQASDWMPLQNILAIEAMIISQNNVRSSDLQEAIVQRQRAQQLMSESSEAYMGPNPKPAVSFENHYGFGNYPKIR